MAVNNAVEGGESFDSTATITDRYVNAGTNPTQIAISTTNPRTGPRCLVLTAGFNATAYIALENLASRTARFFHLAFRLESDKACTILAANEGATTHVFLTVLAGVLSVRRGDGGSGTILASSATTLTTNQWYSLKVWFSVHDTTGRARVKVNTTTVIDFTGDTRNGATGVQNQFRLGQIVADVNAVGAVSYRIDDVAWMNGDHVDAVDFDDVRVDYLPANGAGDSTQFVPSAGSNFQNVDEAPPDDDTTYNDATAVNDIDRYDLAAMAPNPGFIYGVEHIFRARKLEAGSGELRGHLKHSVTVTNLTTRALNTTYQTFFEFLADVPGSTGWTEAQVNALLHGNERTL